MASALYPSLESESHALFEKARNVIAGGTTRDTVYFSPYPIYAKSGQGASFVDEDGVERIDFTNSLSSGIHGHCHPALVQSITAQAQQLIGVSLPTRLEIELAEVLVERIPAFEQVRFTNSGTEAVMLAVKAARAFTGKSKIAKAEGTYHGTLDLAEVSQNASPENWGELERPNAVATAAGTPDTVLNESVIIPFNDLEKSIVILEQQASDLAAILIDLVPGVLRFLMADQSYIDGLHDWAKSRGVLLIFDEIMTARGSQSGMQKVYGITPDISTVGKFVGGGMPLGVVGGRRDVMSVFDSTADGGALVPQGGSFNGHPLSMAAGITSMKLMDESAYAHLAMLGDRLRNGLRNAMDATGVKGQVHGYGSMIGFTLVEGAYNDRRGLYEVLEREQDLMLRLSHYWFNHGVFALPRGGLLLSTAMTTNDIDYMLEMTYQFMKNEM